MATGFFQECYTHTFRFPTQTHNPGSLGKKVPVMIFLKNNNRLLLTCCMTLSKSNISSEWRQKCFLSDESGNFIMPFYADNVEKKTANVR